MRAIEAIENICDEMSNYGESEEEGRKTYVRVRLLAFSLRQGCGRWRYGRVVYALAFWLARRLTLDSDQELIVSLCRQFFFPE